MASSASRSPRRSDALTRERIVEATIELLDGAGESNLTVRALTTHLATGRGAIYHHVSSKEELLAAATDAIIGRVVAGADGDGDPSAAIRALALGIFDAINAHPWVGAQLAREPLQPAVLRIWKAVGSHLHRVGVSGSALSDAGSALVNYVLGSAAQHAAGALSVPDAADRKAYLEALAATWAEHDPDPIAQQGAALLKEHDDREQFLAGVDIFLAGIASRR
ncbi:TetR/AcrR family transcriptional regulator [Nocardioides sp. W7]|uniref:TetR/AcrR family transcriptional regulator n=1 Tax=Nocardioides sp. W7 TaxID=2931390 RepID=UPI001FD3908D|nr:TetR/AcrR family transcriptional regulator [Nocardioides sp. W7]